MKIALISALLGLSVTGVAMAQGQPPSSAAQTFAAQHQLQVCQTDDSQITARAYDIEAQLQSAQAQISSLQTELAAAQKSAKTTEKK